MTRPDAAAARAVLDRLLSTDPMDAGCARTEELLAAYADLVAAGQDPELSYPGITVHLRQCTPCQDDLDGLLARIEQLRDS